MGINPINYTVRQAKRIVAIAENVVEEADPKKIALQVLAPETITVAKDYLGAQQRVVEIESLHEKEKGESVSALEQCRAMYDEIAPIIGSKLMITLPASSTYATRDNYFSAAETMEGLLIANNDKEWAQKLLERFSGLLNNAAKEYSESVLANRSLQKAQKRRNEMGEEFRDVLVPFRQVVRATYGSESNEYRSLVDKRYRSTDDGETPEPPQPA